MKKWAFILIVVLALIMVAFSNGVKNKPALPQMTINWDEQLAQALPTVTQTIADVTETVQQHKEQLAAITTQDWQTRLQSPMMIGQSMDEHETILGAIHDTAPQLGHNQQFKQRVSREQVDTISVRKIQNSAYKLFQGKVIPAVLETAVQSDLPGMLRAIISEDVYGETGEFNLLPKGTRLIGTYNSELTANQARIYAIWTRAITPDHQTIQLSSPSSDPLGRAGISGKVDRHFWQTFGKSLLLSVMGAGVNQLDFDGGNQGLEGNEYQSLVMRSLLQSSNQILQQQLNIPPTIHINQGEKIVVFVAQDLDFTPQEQYES